MADSLQPTAADVAVTVVVVTWQGRQLLQDCLTSLTHQTVPHHVLVVDNASTDGTADWLRSTHPEAGLLTLRRNVGFAGGVAAALKRVETPFVALLNNDAEAEPDWLARLLDRINDPSCAAVTSRILLREPPGLVNNAGVVLDHHGRGVDRGLREPNGPAYAAVAEVAAFCGGACLLRTDAVRGVGGFPAEFFLYYEDVDLSWRLVRSGFRIAYEPQAIVRHRHSATSDPSSAAFAVWNLRNHLLVLIRNAPTGLVLREITRFVLVSVLDLRYLGRPAVAAQRRIGCRATAALGVLRAIPSALAERRRNAGLAMPRSAFTRRWLGVDTRPW